MYDNQTLDKWSQDWAQWHRSRRLFAPPVPQNILARMRPQPVREAPDAILSSDLSIFNLAVLAQPESQAKFIFYLFYLYEARNIKVIAAEMGFSTSYFYRLLREFREKAYRSYRAMMAGKVEEREAEVA